MTQLDSSINEHYSAYKKHWDTVPAGLQKQIKALISTTPFEKHGREFILGFTMGCNVSLEHMLNWVNTALDNSPRHSEILNLRDMVSWTLVALFLDQYELTLLESSNKGSVN